MKTYRKAVADAFVLQQVLSYLSERADDMESSAEDYRSRYENSKSEGVEDSWTEGCAVEYAAKAAAFERMLEKISK